MSDGQSHGERLESEDLTQRWLRPFQPILHPVQTSASADAEERQRARDHELAMARVENESALVEARVRLASAWLPDAVGVTVAAAAAGGALLGALFSWAVLR